MNPTYRHFLVSNGRIFFFGLSTAICWETYLHTFAMCLSNVILSSTATPSISNSPVMEIAVFSITGELEMLGVAVDDKMKFERHIAIVCS